MKSQSDEVTIKRILILSANPSGTKKLRLDEEVRAIQEGLRRARNRDCFEIFSVWAVRSQDIRRSIIDLKPNIVHFSGHGVADAGLAFENGDLGQIHLVNSEALAELFRLVADYVECVLLNACYSAKQASAIVRYIDFVVGMDAEIGDRAAIEFAIGFYDAIGAGYPVPIAYEFGCNAIQLAGIQQHLKPVLDKKSNSETLDLDASPESLAYENEPVTCSVIAPISSKITYEFVLSGSVDEFNKQRLEAIVDHLQKLTGDTTLTLRKVKPGSVKLILEGSPEGFRQLQALFETGQLKEILNFEVQSISSSDSEAQELQKMNHLWGSHENQIPIEQLNSSDSMAQVGNLPIYRSLGKNYRGVVLSVRDLQGFDFKGADLSEAILTGTDLCRANLEETNLSGANLRGANLRGANLIGADLSNADLREADLHHANLSCANLSAANLETAKLGNANLYNARLNFAKLSHASIRGVNLSCADLSNADLSHADLTGANCRQALFSFANLGQAILERVDLTNANLQTVTDLSRAKLNGSVLVGADLTNVDLTETDLSGSLLERTKLNGTQLCAAKLTGAILERAQLSRANLSHANLRGARIRRANLSYAKLNHAKLAGASLRGTDLSHAELQGAFLSRANLMFANLNSAILIDVNLTNAYLRGVDLRNATLKNANLSGAKLVAANLHHADLQGAILLRTNLSNAQLQHCILTEARLNRAYLSGAFLVHAQLQQADLSGAYVLRADFRGANLQETALIRAYLSDTNLDGADLSHADLNGTNLTRVKLDNTIVDGAVFEANLGLSESQKSELHEQGAIIMPLPLGSSPLFPNNEELELLPLFDEAKGDLRYRFLDLEEALDVFREAIDLLRQEQDVQAQDIQVLEGQCDRFQQEIEEYQQELFDEIEHTINGDLSEWLSQEFPEILDNLHEKISQLTCFAYSIHQSWINLSEQNVDATPTDSEEF